MLTLWDGSKNSPGRLSIVLYTSSAEEQCKSCLRAVQHASCNSGLPTYVDPALETRTHIFLCHDAVRSPLQPPYDGPYEVVKWQGKSYVIKINGKECTVSLDHLKPAHLEPPATDKEAHSPDSGVTVFNDPFPSPQPHPTSSPRTSRSGRRIRWPQHLRDYKHDHHIVHFTGEGEYCSDVLI